MDATLVTPSQFATDRHGEQQEFQVEREDRDNFHQIPLPTTRGRGLYRGLGGLLRRSRPDLILIFEEPVRWMLRQWFLAARILTPRAVRLFYYYTTTPTHPDKLDRRVKQAAVFHLADGAFVAVLKRRE